MSEDKEETIQDEEFQDHPEVIDLKKKLTGMSKDSMKKTTDDVRSEISQLSSKIDQLKKLRERKRTQR